MMSSGGKPGSVGYFEIFLNTMAYKLSPSCTWLRPDFSEGLTLNSASTTSAERVCSSCGCCPGVQVPDPTTFHWSAPTGVAWMVTLYTVVGDMGCRGLTWVADVYRLRRSF